MIDYVIWGQYSDLCVKLAIHGNRYVTTGMRINFHKTAIVAEKLNLQS